MPTTRRVLTYVERLVIATVMDPLREDGGPVLSTAERQMLEANQAPPLRPEWPNAELVGNHPLSAAGTSGRG